MSLVSLHHGVPMRSPWNLSDHYSNILEEFQGVALHEVLRLTKTVFIQGNNHHSKEVNNSLTVVNLFASVRRYYIGGLKFWEVLAPYWITIMPRGAVSLPANVRFSSLEKDAYKFSVIGVNWW